MKCELEMLPRRLALLPLHAYRTLVSPLLMGLFGSACRFEPSCSRYAIEATGRYGMARGVLMAAWRLARCHPLGGHGYDPVIGRPVVEK